MPSILRLPSGRAIQYETLDPTQVDDVWADAAKTVGASSTMLDLQRKVRAIGSRLMIRAVSGDRFSAEEWQKATATDEARAQIKWLQLHPLQLEESFRDWFSTKDAVVMSAMFRREHEIDDAELESIMGKAIEVPAG